MISCGEPPAICAASAVELRAGPPDAVVRPGLSDCSPAAVSLQVSRAQRDRAARSGPVSVRSISPARRSRWPGTSEALVAIDFPDYSAPARRATARYCRLLHQSSASRRPRHESHEAHRQQVPVIFLEEDFYRRAGIPVEFVGHPLVDLAKAHEPRDAFLRGAGLDPGRPVVALLPGSRPNEVTRLLPVLSDAARLVAGRLPQVQFIVARAPSLDDRLFSQVNWHGLQTATVLARTDDALAASDVAVTASGTATVQAARGRRWSWCTGCLP